MGWTFKLHGGVAAGLGAVLLTLAALIPGVLLVGASCMVLAAGEVRRADRGVAAR
ncbi:hypothetical protein ACFY9Q_05690 [Streptomyces sp. NPDC012389]|uniref:hypothetical protein n=1 Tax=unclassified Streptomyces TaxID=2593676 RepID=UPI0013C917E6|nr:hypothetical protein [Streptomyces sp. SID8374]MYX16742.1 hypothetical protein [Streptomyces sp. SID8374]